MLATQFHAPIILKPTLESCYLGHLYTKIPLEEKVAKQIILANNPARHSWGLHAHRVWNIDCTHLEVSSILISLVHFDYTSKSRFHRNQMDVGMVQANNKLEVPPSHITIPT